MQIRSILLGRYGGYEGRHVDFGPGLTVVVGPNEAGKSTLLDALTDVLWGYPRPVRHAYLVNGSRLDLTATITVDADDGIDDGATGEVVTIRRTPKTVSGPAVVWGVVDQDARRAWRQGFGLSHAELRRGGQTLCEGGGDLAELVFAARSGNDVRSILSGLAEEAERLYKPHKGAKSVEVRAAVARADQAEAQLRLQMATATDVAAAEDRIHRAEASRSNATADHAAAAQAAQIARQQAAAFPHAVELARSRAELAHLHAEAAVPDRPQLEALASATTTFDQAHRDLADLETTLEARKTERDALEIDDAVLADAAAITALGHQLEARAQDRDRLALLTDQAQAHRRSAVIALDDLTGPDLRSIPERLRDVHVPIDRAAALDELGAELMRAETTNERLRASYLEALRRVGAVAGSFEPIDVEAAHLAVELRRRVTMNDSPVALHQAAITACATSGGELQRALKTVRDLAGPVGPDNAPLQTTEWPSVGPSHARADRTDGTDGDIDSVGADTGPTNAFLAQAPPAARMTELRDRLRAATTSAESATRDHAKAVERLQHAQLAMLAVRTDASLPSPDLLHEVRAQRNNYLDTMLDALRDGNTPTLMSAVVGFVRASMSADHIADDLIAGADRLAELGRREADVHTADRGVTDAARAVDATQQEHRFAHAQWTALWTAGGAPVPHPDVADNVHRALQDAHRAHADLLQAALRQDEFATEAAHLREQLRAALAAAGHSRPDADLPTLLAVADEVENHVARATEHRTRLAERREQAHHVGNTADAARQDRDEAATRWRFNLAAGGLPTDLTPAQWATRCETIATARRAHTAAEHLDEEAAGIRTILAAFDALVAKQTAQHNLTNTDTAAAVSELTGRLTTAESTRIAAGHHNREIATLTGTIEKAEIAASAAAATRQRIATELDIDIGEIPAALARGRRHIDLNAAIERVTALVRTAGPDLDVDALLATVEHHSQHELDETREVAQAREKAQRTRLDAVAEELGGLRRDLDERQNTQPAAVLHAIATEHTAQASEAAQRYIVLQLQREILSRGLAAYERQHSSQLLTTAGELLERLTDGRYVAVRARANDNQRSLVVVRADDEEQTLDELSEGTADQLYLALRLAGIDQLQTERTHRGLTTVPVVLDDILVTFDDTRAAAAVGVLTELSARWQIILLTHHEHLVELARGVEINTPTITPLAPPPSLEITRDPKSIRTA